MTSPASPQEDILAAICVWFLFVTFAMISALWPKKQTKPMHQRCDSTCRTETSGYRLRVGVESRTSEALAVERTNNRKKNHLPSRELIPWGHPE